ncbi:ATP-binding protein [Intestinibacter bartlettii]|uniref:histidine kinase n=2 Tax=Intestinibacter bartlettii TaxID=261299 RepID=A0ABS6DV06_9FIRM|nr:ATP-binding protein [Intestinibacter bartlettii]MBU5335131.1 PAS domain-containing protein [Intestinibacter bartlettii]
MNMLDKIVSLNNINFVIVTSIAAMSIFIYCLKKQSYYICFTVVYFIEMVVCASFFGNILYKYYGLCLEGLFIIKMLCTIFHRSFLKLEESKKFILLVISLIGVILTNYDITSGLIINVLANIYIFYQYIYSVLGGINSDLYYMQVQTSANETYINDLNRDIYMEINYKEDLNEKEEQFDDMYDVWLSNNRLPILILNNNKLVYINDHFNKLFENINLKKFDIESFFKDYFYDGQNIIKNIQQSKDIFRMDIKSFKDKIYTLDVFSIIHENEKLKIFQFYDITTTYKQEEEIKFNENSYKKLIEVMDDGIIIADKNHIKYMNKKVNEIFNLQKDIYSIEDLAKHISNIDRQNFIKNIVTNRVSQKDKIWYTNTSRNKVLKVSQSVLNMEEEDLKLIILSDITENQQLMEDIEERETIYRVLLEALPDGVIIIDKATRKYIYKNKYMIEQFKKIGVDVFNNIIEEYIDLGEFDKVNIVNINKKQNASIVITDINNEDVYIIIFKLLENNQKIENVKDRFKKTQQTEDFKTQFCIDVVDKIERPVDDMLHENKIMQQQIQSPLIENHVELVKKNLYRLKKVLDNINDIMAIENFTYNLDYVVFDIVQLIKDISHLSEYYIKRKHLNLELEFSDPEILVYLDTIKLQKIILNILSNAIKFTDKGGTIKISIEKKIDFIVVSIKDNGIGIPKDQMDFIFENFEQIDRGLSRLAEGMGMGLYLVKQLTEIQDLYLNVESELNKGSEFKILIKNTEKSFLKNKYKKQICIEKEFVDIQFADIYPA